MKVQRSERGAASLEYAGILFVVIALVGGVGANITPVGEQIKAKICEAVGATCPTQDQEQRANDLPTCVVSREERTLGYGGNVRVININRTDGDNVTVNADGSASFTTTQGSAAGVGISGKKLKEGSSADPSVDAKIQVTGDVTYVYNVPEEWGGGERATQFRDDRNGTLDRYGRLIVGPAATTIDEGLNRVGNALGGLGRGINKLVTGNEESAEDREAREAEESLNEADAIKASLGIQGSAGGSIKAGESAEFSASGKGSLKGEVTIPLNTSGPDAATATFNATVNGEGEVAALLGIPADDIQGLDAIPPFLNLAVGGGKKFSYTVAYDEDGNPTKLTMQIDTQTAFTGGVKGKAGSGNVTGKGGASANVGSLTTQQTILDLTVPENREAFDAVFATYGTGVAGHQARVSTPKSLLSPAYTLATLNEHIDAFNQLQQRFEQDAFVVDYEYETDGSGLTAGGSAKEDGVDLAVAGVTWENSSKSTELVSATARDNRYPGAEIQLTEGCGG